MRRVHELRTLEGTVLYPDLNILTIDKHWKVTPETQVCSCSRVILFCDFGKRRTTGYIQFDNYAMCAAITVPSREVTNNSGSTRVELPKGVGNQTRNMLERGMATCGKAARARAKMRSRARKEASSQEVREYYKQFAEAKHPRVENLD